MSATAAAVSSLDVADAAPPGEPTRFADTLPVPVIELVLSFREGDTATLCAAACVARAWREAARQPRLWRWLLFSGGYKCTRMDLVTDERLAALVARAGGALERLHLKDVAPGFGPIKCTLNVSAGGVVAALRGNAPLRELHVRGLLGDGATFAELRALVVDDGSLDVTDGATCGMPLKSKGDHPCKRLCDVEHDRVCEDCDTYCCVQCRPYCRLLPCCDACELCGRGEFDSLRLCNKCSRHGRGNRVFYVAFCDNCTATCGLCQAYTMCNNCCAVSCEVCGTAFCEECWLARGAASDCCQGCLASVCSECGRKARRSGAGLSMSRCTKCRKNFCYDAKGNGGCLSPKVPGDRELYCEQCQYEEASESGDEEED